MTEITDADREAANKALDIAFQGDTTTIDDDMARLFIKYRIDAFAAGEAKEREDVVAWLRQYDGDGDALTADAIERGEHKK